MSKELLEHADAPAAPRSTGSPGAPPAAEPLAEDTRARAQLCVEAALDRKAEDVVALDVHGLTSFAEAFIVLSGRSDRQVRAIADSIVQAMKRSGHPPLGVEGTDEGHWVLIDGGDVVVHVFDPETRERYDLERLWSDAPPIALEGVEASGGETGAAG